MTTTMMMKMMTMRWKKNQPNLKKNRKPKLTHLKTNPKRKVNLIIIKVINSKIKANLINIIIREIIIREIINLINIMTKIKAVKEVLISIRENSTINAKGEI